MPRGVITDPPASPGTITRTSGGKKNKRYIFIPDKGYSKPFIVDDKVTFTTKGHSPGWGFEVKHE